MKKIHLIFTLLLLFAAAFSSDAQISKYDSSGIKDHNSLFNTNKTSFKMEVGAGFIGGSASGMYTYLSPYFRYQLTPKFSLDMGGILTQGTGNFSAGNNGTYSLTGGALFARGNYLLTDKLTVSGSYYKVFLPSSFYTNDINKRYSNQNYSYSLGMDYKISKHFSLGAQVIVNKGLNYNPMFQSEPSLFGGSSFGNRYGIFGW